MVLDLAPVIAVEPHVGARADVQKTGTRTPGSSTGVRGRRAASVLLEIASAFKNSSPACSSQRSYGGSLLLWLMEHDKHAARPQRNFNIRFKASAHWSGTIVQTVDVVAVLERVEAISSFPRYHPGRPPTLQNVVFLRLLQRQPQPRVLVQEFPSN